MRRHPQILEQREVADAESPSSAVAQDRQGTNTTTTTGEQQQTAPAPAPLPLQNRGGILAPPGQQRQQSPSRPAQRTRAPESRADESDDETSSDFLPKTARPDPRTGIAFPAPPEPELPPSRPDPISSSPAKGIHSSPSRWKTKSKQKSSPLKQPPMRPGDGGEPQPVPTPLVLQRRQNPPAAAAATTTTSGDDDASARNHPIADPARHVSLQDHEKIKERDALREQYAQLQKDLEMAAHENARLLGTQNTGRYVEPADKDKILDLLRRSLIPADPLALPPQSQQLMMAALNPIGLLPFSRPVAALVPESADDDAAAAKDIKSHHPIEMSVEDELPYLRLFTPFEVTSTMATLPATREHPFRQRRLLTLHTPQSRLFQARVEIIVNPMTLAILELRVLSVEPAARGELQSFIDTICGGGSSSSGKPCNRSMQRNVGMLFWAMGEWYEAAVERAAVWARLDQELLTKGGPARAAAALRRRAERGEKEAERDDDEGADDAGAAATTAAVQRGANVRYLMGKQAYDIPIEAASDGRRENAAHIRLQWKIGFDWTGEAESKLSVLVGVPGKCESFSPSSLQFFFLSYARTNIQIDASANHAGNM